MPGPAPSRADEVESVLLATAKSLLGVSEIKMTDNFFDLGGHSILAAKLVGRMEQVIGHRASLRHVFEAEDMRDLSARLGALAEKGDRG
ncbi:phosphopantetheine-binding protein [Actinocrispum wychmicini]|uniref:Phosphopantetheine binding protein n=1 Tax=Actinocrispum wychmicini TaxID=1213861 RepID=A0A4R2JQ79_9PSEU|nr:phosphopantetheine-binding protein [Actinocrispum wychmicini]TCO61177.1 phosphopantetheine binding protein [Actinocrispum wychmicini]